MVEAMTNSLVVLESSAAALIGNNLLSASTVGRAGVKGKGRGYKLERREGAHMLGWRGGGYKLAREEQVGKGGMSWLVGSSKRVLVRYTKRAPTGR